MAKKKFPVCPTCGATGWGEFKWESQIESRCRTCNSVSVTKEILTTKSYNAYWIIGIMLLTAFLLWLPATRMIILFILPLGFRADDIMVWLVILAVVALFSRGWITKLSNFLSNTNRKD